jgi:hypothetical protein
MVVVVPIGGAAQDALRQIGGGADITIIIRMVHAQATKNIPTILELLTTTTTTTTMIVTSFFALSSIFIYYRILAKLASMSSSSSSSVPVRRRLSLSFLALNAAAKDLTALQKTRQGVHGWLERAGHELHLQRIERVLGLTDVLFANGQPGAIQSDQVGRPE